MTRIEETALHEQLHKALASVWEEASRKLEKPVTSLGLKLYGYDGLVSIHLNTSDDQSFQTEMMEHFEGSAWAKFEIRGPGEWATEGEEMVFVERNGATHKANHETDAAYGAFFDSLMEGTKAFVLALPEQAWKPHHIVFQEAPVLMDGGMWECPGGIALPPRMEVEPLAINGFRSGEPRGFKVYTLGYREKKFCGLRLDASELGRALQETRPLAEEWPSGANVKAWAEHVRKGPLAQVDDAFALHADVSDSVMDWLRPYAEFLPVEDEDGDSWMIVHLMGEYKGLNPLPQKLPALLRHGDRSIQTPLAGGPGLSRETWLSQNAPIFRFHDGENCTTFIIEEAGNPEGSFMDLCRQHNLRGIQYDLFWCEDTEFLRDRLKAVAEQIRDKVERRTGSRTLPSPSSEVWTDRDYHLAALDENTQDPSDLKGHEAYLSKQWRFYAV